MQEGRTQAHLKPGRRLLNRSPNPPPQSPPPLPPLR
uniref:Uncharacterized protein n=1 Tax=Arundo donax TaxID=35708 RepID=A0A0A8ZE87_ARUDO